MVKRKGKDRIKCPICQSNNIISLESIEGYVKETYFIINECETCQTQFISEKYDKRIYEIIYSAKGSFGYERYASYVAEIKKQKNPLDWLAHKEPAYLYVEQYLRGKSKLKILEVGCGDGYLSYALCKAGHRVVGIDVSKEAISVAKRNFGDFYQAVDIKNFKCAYNFDLIVCTETIEHLENPSDFIKECKRLLKPNGEILLTTPNKDYRSPNTIWQTELPPIHRFWLGHKSFEAIAKKNEMQCDFLPLVMPMDMERNNIVAYFSSRGSNKFGSVLDEQGKVIESKPSTFRKFLRGFFMWSPVRYFCNAIPLYSPLSFFRIKEAPTLGVILGKKV